MNNQAARNYASPPSRQREDLRYGDPHLQRGQHLYYGPDSFALRLTEREKPALESHGFYLEAADASREPRGLWAKLKRRIIGERIGF